MVVGAAATAAGAVLVALPPRVDPADPLLETTTRPPGAVVLGAGVAMLVSGAVMLVVDRRRTHGPAARRLQPALGGWVLRF